jgi:hypothetical protein
MVISSAFINSFSNNNINFKFKRRRREQHHPVRMEKDAPRTATILKLEEDNNQTIETKSSFVRSAIGVSATSTSCKTMSERTLGRSPTSAQSVTNGSLETII